MSDYQIEEGDEVRIPNLIFEKKESEEVRDVLFFDAIIDRVEGDSAYISTTGKNYFDELKLPVTLLQSWQYRPYIDPESYEKRGDLSEEYR